MRHSLRARLAVGVATVAASLSLAVPAQAARPFDWTNARISLPWTAGPFLDGSTCPGGRLQFTALGEVSPGVGEAERDGFRYYVRVHDSADVTGDGRTDTVIEYHCTSEISAGGMAWFYLYTVRRNRPVLLDYITSAHLSANRQYDMAGPLQPRLGEVLVTQFDGVLVSRTFTWDGHQLTPDQPLPLHPEADIAP